MRTINIKNIRQTYIHHVLTGLLLLSFAGFLQSQPNELFTQAIQQQTKLVEKFGLVENKWWQDRCDQLIAQMTLSGFNRCLMVDADFANAYSLAHGVLILTKGLLLNINNNDQLAHIMAHEHAHLALKHHYLALQMVKNPPTFFTKSRLKKFYRKIEQEADQQADIVLMAHGKDPKQIHHYLLRIEHNTEEHSNDHQKLKNRIQRNNLPDEVIETFWANDGLFLR